MLLNSLLLFPLIAAKLNPQRRGEDFSGRGCAHASDFDLWLDHLWIRSSLHFRGVQIFVGNDEIGGEGRMRADANAVPHIVLPRPVFSVFRREYGVDVVDGKSWADCRSRLHLAFDFPVVDENGRRMEPRMHRSHLYADRLMVNQTNSRGKCKVLVREGQTAEGTLGRVFWNGDMCVTRGPHGMLGFVERPSANHSNDAWDFR